MSFLDTWRIHEKSLRRGLCHRNDQLHHHKYLRQAEEVCVNVETEKSFYYTLKILRSLSTKVAIAGLAREERLCCLKANCTILTAMMFRALRRCITGFAFAIVLLPVAALAQSFKDVPQSNPAFAAVEYLKAKGILQGYADGTFKPGQQVNRAEAIKILAAQLVSADKLPSGISVYGDVPADAWFAPYIEVARAQFGIIDGPPKTSMFNPTKPVKKVEFLKMLLLAQKIDPAASYSEFQRTLSQDVPNPNEWYYPYMRYAMTASMLLVNEDGTLEPAKELTRSDIAQLFYHFLMYREGRRTQALLTLTENEIINVLEALNNKNLPQAQFASARALLAARGAHAAQPDENIVKSALKTAEGFQHLVDAYRAGTEGRLDDVISLCGKAWNLADQAKQFSPQLEKVATEMQNIAKTMADEARKLKAE